MHINQLHARALAHALAHVLAHLSGAHLWGTSLAHVSGKGEPKNRPSQLARITPEAHRGKFISISAETWQPDAHPEAGLDLRWRTPKLASGGSTPRPHPVRRSRWTSRRGDLARAGQA